MKDPDQGQSECTGPPREDSPFRCQGKSRVTEKRCRLWAIRGRKWCQFHGGRTLRGPRTASNQFNSDRRMVVYDQWLGETLRKKVQEFVGQPHDDAVSLYHELALARSVLTDSITLYSAAIDGNVDSETRMLAATVMNTCLDRVRELVLACSRIEKDADDKISMKVVYLFMGQITTAIHKALSGDEDLALKIVEQIKEDVRLPKAGEDFTESIIDVSTPADIVLAMDKATLGEEDDVDTSLDETPPT